MPCDVPAPERECHCHAGERVVERDLGIAVSGNGVVAASTFETIERVAGTVHAGAAGVRERPVATVVNPAALKMSLKLEPEIHSIDSKVSVRVPGPTTRSRRKLNVYAGDFIAVDRGVKTVAAIDEVVAAAAFKKLCCPGWVVASREGVIEIRAAHAVDAADEGVIADSCESPGPVPCAVPMPKAEKSPSRRPTRVHSSPVCCHCP